MSAFNLATQVDPGSGRLWNVVHEPRKPKTPLRLELRESVTGEEKPRLAFTTVIGYVETEATEQALQVAAAYLLEITKLVGVYQL